MVGGFNHNFLYQGEQYHVQTEDSGPKNARIVTLLFRDGTILASEKHSYADLAGREDLAQLVEERMKNQHREMMRRLRDGEFDEVIRRLGAGAVEPAVDLTSGEGQEAQPKEDDLEAVVFAYLTADDSRYQNH
jgi:hypothetical protein